MFLTLISLVGTAFITSCIMLYRITVSDFFAGHKNHRNHSFAYSLTHIAYFESCSYFYSQCIAKNGLQAGSVFGTTRCLECMNQCNRSNGWFPLHLPGCSA